MNSKELQEFIEKLKKQKSKEYFKIFTDFQELFKKYFKKQVKQYLKQVDELPLQKSFDDEVERKLMKALKLAKKEEIEDFIKDKIRVGEKKEDILLNNDFLKEYAKTRAGELIQQIDETTKKIIQDVFTNAFKNGYTKQEVAEIIREKFDTFAGTRATLIAHMEIANAYAWARKKTYEKIQEKAAVRKWKIAKTQHDDKVRPSHRANELEDWIPAEQPYPGTGTLHAPHGFFCRCDDIYTYINPKPNTWGEDVEYSPEQYLQVDKYLKGYIENIKEEDKKLINKYNLLVEEYAVLKNWKMGYVLENGFYKAETSKKYQAFIPFFNKALYKLPFIEGVFYRGEKKEINLSVNQTFYFGTFKSASLEKEIAEQFTENTIFVIKSSYAKNLTEINPEEKEVIFLPYQRFVVKNIENKNGYTTIYIEDLNK